LRHFPNTPISPFEEAELLSTLAKAIAKLARHYRSVDRHNLVNMKEMSWLLREVLESRQTRLFGDSKYGV